MPRYWASYGTCGFLGCFEPAEAAVAFARGEGVIVQSPRGREPARVLDAVDERCVPPGFRSGGTILRRLTESDAQAAANREALLAECVQAVNAAAADQPLVVPDVELLDDGDTLIVHVLPWAEADFTDWAEALAEQLGRAVLLLNVADLPREPEAGGCGTKSCGTGGGCGDCGSGCGTGSCSRGSVKSAEELTAYFASLRTQMENRRSLA